MNRRDELLAQVTDYVLREGLIGLTLRPLAEAIGTSDRMLIYHFGTRDELVSDVVVEATRRAIEAVEQVPAAPTIRSAVNRLWAAYQTQPLHACLQVYLQAAATGLIGHEPHLSLARDANEQWAQALRDYFVRSGAPARRVVRLVNVVDSALYGFHLDLVTDRPDELAKGVDDLAVAVQALASVAA